MWRAHMEPMPSTNCRSSDVAASREFYVGRGLEVEHLDTGGLARHLAARGYSALLIDIDRAATMQHHQAI